MTGHKGSQRQASQATGQARLFVFGLQRFAFFFPTQAQSLLGCLSLVVKSGSSSQKGGEVGAGVASTSEQAPQATGQARLFVFDLQRFDFFFPTQAQSLLGCLSLVVKSGSSSQKGGEVGAGVASSSEQASQATGQARLFVFDLQRFDFFFPTQAQSLLGCLSLVVKSGSSSQKGGEVGAGVASRSEQAPQATGQACLFVFDLQRFRLFFATQAQSLLGCLSLVVKSGSSSQTGGPGGSEGGNGGGGGGGGKGLGGGLSGIGGEGGEGGNGGGGGGGGKGLGGGLSGIGGEGGEGGNGGGGGGGGLSGKGGEGGNGGGGGGGGKGLGGGLSGKGGGGGDGGGRGGGGGEIGGGGELGDAGGGLGGGLGGGGPVVLRS